MGAILGVPINDSIRLSLSGRPCDKSGVCYWFEQICRVLQRFDCFPRLLPKYDPNPKP